MSQSTVSPITAVTNEPTPMFALSFPPCHTRHHQSLETTVATGAVRDMEAHMEVGDLVVGAALTGHAFQGGETLELTGVTTPWNTLALWDVANLAKLG